MNNIFLLLSLYLLPVFNFNSHTQKKYAPNSGTVKIIFVNTVKGKPLELNTGSYTNPFGEMYSVSKFKYYISHVYLTSDKAVFFDESYHLIDESKPDALHFSFALGEGHYNNLNFLLGVDSLHNVSGAQTGALDPLNDMFWTWNNGYVMAKLEGRSPQSKLVNKKLEYHIGGFMGEHNVLKNITLNFAPGKFLNIQPGKTSEIIIEADIDTWWQQPNDIKITEHPICSTPGTLAKKIADNYSKMFRIKDVINQ